MADITGTIFVAGGALLLGVAIGNPLVGSGVFLVVIGLSMKLKEKK